MNNKATGCFAWMFYCFGAKKHIHRKWSPISLLTVKASLGILWKINLWCCLRYHAYVNLLEQYSESAWCMNLPFSQICPWRLWEWVPAEINIMRNRTKGMHTYTYTLLFKVWGQYDFFKKEINTFIQQGCIKLWQTFVMFQTNATVNKCCSF